MLNAELKTALNSSSRIPHSSFPFRSHNPVCAARGAAGDARLAEDFRRQQLAVNDQLLVAELPVLARQLRLRAVPLGQKVRAVVQALGLGLVAGLAQQLRQAPDARVKI